MRFEELWNAHPEVNGDEHPCRRTDGEKAFDDQCAIRIGTALARCGYDVTKLNAEFCWLHPKRAGHVLRAEELAKALKKAAIPDVFPAQRIDPKNFEEALREKTGIIFFKDYWRRGGESYLNRTGDHIDLWNRYRLTTSTSYFRIQWGVSWEGFMSSFFEAREVWFWKVL